MKKIIKPIKKIKYKVYKNISYGYLFCYNDIVSNLDSTDEDSEDRYSYEESETKFFLRKPKIIVKTERNDRQFYLNQAFPQRAGGVLFSYNKEFYNQLCTGSWAGILNKCKRKDLDLLLFDYLTTFNYNGYWIPNSHTEYCVLCGDGYDDDYDKICGNCSYKITDKHNKSIFVDDLDMQKINVNKIKYNNDTSRFIYNG